MGRLKENMSVKVDTDDFTAFGRIESLSDDVVFTDPEKDQSKGITIKVFEVIEGDVERDSLQTCQVRDVVEYSEGTL